MNITVTGAGISGLSCAYILSKKGHHVKIIAKEFSPNITSDKAAAFWFPYHIQNDERGINWCRRSYEEYKSLSGKPTGVSMQKLVKVVKQGEQEKELLWLDFMPENSYSKMNTDEVPQGFAMGYEVQVPLIETQIFLPWLMHELQKINVEIEKKEITTFDEIHNADIIVNCTALGSRELCKDDTIIPIRGQVALLSPEKFPFIFLDNETPLYIVPRQDAIIIGGTFEENIYEAICEPPTIEKILDNAYHLFPKLKNQKVIAAGRVFVHIVL